MVSPKYVVDARFHGSRCRVCVPHAEPFEYWMCVFLLGKLQSAVASVTRAFKSEAHSRFPKVLHFKPSEVPLDPEDRDSLRSVSHQGTVLSAISPLQSISRIVSTPNEFQFTD